MELADKAALRGELLFVVGDRKTPLDFSLPKSKYLSVSSQGFVSMVDGSTVAYLVTSPFSPSEEFEINPLDPAIGIEWGLPVGELLLSPKDAAAPRLAERAAQGKLPL